MSTEVHEKGVIFDDVDLEHNGKATVMYAPKTHELVIGIRGMDRIGITTIASNPITPDQADDYADVLKRAAAKARAGTEASQ